MITLFDVNMPHMGSVEFALLTEWLSNPGDRISEGDALCEVSTDKVDTEVESPAEGILISYTAAVDEEIPVGNPIAKFAPLDSDPELVAKAIAEASGDAPVSEPQPTSTSVSSVDVTTAPSASTEEAVGTVATPVTDTRRIPPPNDSLILAASWLDPVAPPTTGSRRTAPAQVANTDRVSSADAPDSVAARPATGEPTLPAGYDDVGYEAVELSRLRRSIARNLQDSWNTAPQLTAQVDIDFTAVSVARAKLNRTRVARDESKISFLPYLAFALCRAAAEHPDVNATFTDSHLIRWKPINLGVAVDTPNGLVVPVIHNAQDLSLAGLAAAISDIGTKAASGSLSPEALSGGTITISNSGSVGGVVSTPILTKPQVTSIGFPAIIRTPVARRSADGASEILAIRPIARVGLTFDHRAYDGAEALRTLLSVQSVLESWHGDQG
ncbi:dihydrolipoamide acetyltransferase family protein [Rhodococcus sp. 077-4]|uniref:dihydrolipoamide acetyltransferase family protein n=1 Tax=Rhodococcus sp. 077-4 TaxID=2789271 RepID=UPI0039F5F217